MFPPSPLVDEPLLEPAVVDVPDSIANSPFLLLGRGSVGDRAVPMARLARAKVVQTEKR